jgi:two-component system nitrogen regulation response regulator GlnG
MGRQDEIAELFEPTLGAPVAWIADDDPEMVDVIVSQLHKRGFETVTFLDGDAIAEEIWRMIEEGGLEPPDVVVTDVSMPGSNGLDIVAMLQRAERHIPTIVITGNASSELRSEARRVGAADVFVKPFDVRKLASAIAASI